MIEPNRRVSDRLDYVIVKVTTWVSGLFLAALLIGFLVTGETALLARAVNPLVVGLIGYFMLRRGRPKALVQLLVGGVPTILYTGFVDVDARRGSILGIVAMAIVGVLLVRRYVVVFMAGATLGLAAVGFWWDIGSGATGSGVSENFTPALLFLFTGSLVAWLKREHESAERQLTDLLASKDELIASVSHELRTPLTSVFGYAEVLADQMDELPSAERDEIVGNIVAQSRELAHLIDDLLVVARVDIDALTVVPEQIDLLDECAAVLATDLGEGIVSIDLEGEARPAYGDPARVRQIIRNLISNAVRYGGDSIRVVVSGDDLYSVAVVSDDGPGVPDDRSEEIFQAYRRAHPQKGLTAAVGLGLTVARRLARLMGGDVVYRRHGQRSEFQLWLPVSAPSDQAAAPTGAAAVPDSQPNDRGSAGDDQLPVTDPR